MAVLVRTGVSGWTYSGWRGDFYPRGLPQRLELEHLAARVGCVEVNGSFYSLQRPSSWRSWAAGRRRGSSSPSRDRGSSRT